MQPTSRSVPGSRLHVSDDAGGWLHVVGLPQEVQKLAEDLAVVAHHPMCQDHQLCPDHTVLQCLSLGSGERLALHLTVLRPSAVHHHCDSVQHLSDRFDVPLVRGLDYYHLLIGSKYAHKHHLYCWRTVLVAVGSAVLLDSRLSH